MCGGEYCISEKSINTVYVVVWTVYSLEPLVHLDELGNHTFTLTFMVVQRHIKRQVLCSAYPSLYCEIMFHFQFYAEDHKSHHSNFLSCLLIQKQKQTNVVCWQFGITAQYDDASVS